MKNKEDIHFMDKVIGHLEKQLRNWKNFEFKTLLKNPKLI